MNERISTSKLESIQTQEFSPPPLNIAFLQIRLAKIKARKQLLAEFPEKSIDIDPNPLKRILPDSAFVCYTGSSIRSRSAIRGSDIDGGIVITPRSVSLRDQRRFILELRRQGFKVYSQEQVQRVERAKMLDDEMIGAEGVTEMGQLRLKVIRFETYDEFEEKKRSGKSLVHARHFIIYADD